MKKKKSFLLPVEMIFQSQLFHGGGPYHTETSQLIRRRNQWIDFYMIGTSVMKELRWIDYGVKQSQIIKNNRVQARVIRSEECV